MTRIATGWLVYRLTGSALLLGMVGFAGQIPAFFLAPLAGVWVDRWNRHRVLVFTQILSMLQSFALAGLALNGRINIGSVIGLALLQGLVNAFDMPSRQAFLVEMLENRADLGNAIALNSSMVNGARLIGPALAGMVVAAVGEGYCFLADGISYIAVVISLLAMRIERSGSVRPRKHLLQELEEGWRYIVASSPIRSILLLLALVSLIGMPYTVLVPILAGTVLRGDAHTLGFLMAASGVGALASAISLAVRKSVRGLGKMVAISAGVFGAGLILLGISRSLWLSRIMMLATGYGMMQQMAASNTILQTIVEDDKRGRLMAFYTMAVLGIAPIGSLVAGVSAARVGVPATFIAGGVLCILGAIWFAQRLPAIRRVIRPMYIELGILPGLAAGAESAPALQPSED